MSKPQKDFSHIVSRQYAPNPQWCCEVCVFGVKGEHHPECPKREQTTPETIADLPIEARDWVPEGTVLLIPRGAVRVGVDGFDEHGNLVVKTEIDRSRITVITGISPTPEKSCNKTE